jgi:thiol-disulfide isomerase/thioredoxin
MGITDNVFLRAAVLTTMVFALGLLLGLYIGQVKISGLETDMTGLRSSIDNTELQFLFLDVVKGNISCNYMLSEANELGDESGKLAIQVDRYESAQKIDDASFKELKLSYTSVLIKDWLILEKIKKTCNGSYATILYFYSNKYCPKCQDQAVVLSYLKEKLGNNLMTFALDSDIGHNVVEALKQSYVINTYPSLIINGELYRGYTDLNQTTKALCDYNSTFSICSQH